MKGHLVMCNKIHKKFDASNCTEQTSCKAIEHKQQHKLPLKNLMYDAVNVQARKTNF